MQIKRICFAISNWILKLTNSFSAIFSSEFVQYDLAKRYLRRKELHLLVMWVHSTVQREFFKLFRWKHIGGKKLNKVYYYAYILHFCRKKDVKNADWCFCNFVMNELPINYFIFDGFPKHYPHVTAGKFETVAYIMDMPCCMYRKLM